MTKRVVAMAGTPILLGAVLLYRCSALGAAACGATVLLMIAISRPRRLVVPEPDPELPLRSDGPYR
jgi:hypothetical protein